MIAPHLILNANILIVDDQEANVLLIQRLLAEAGYSRVSTVSDPRAVNALHREQAFDLILLDLQMPLMDGFQVMEALKADAPDDYLPVIVLTAQPGHKLRALQAGAKDFISKPFDLAEVKTRIHNMLEVRLLYRQLEDFNAALELQVAQRTGELRASEARYRSLAELGCDWYWEQDESGTVTKSHGPVMEMLGLKVEPSVGAANDAESHGWNEVERNELRARIQARQPFLDFHFSRTLADGTQHRYRVSGEPMFDSVRFFVGYRGIGVEVPTAS
jgi:CheY-like chemotaxis protein